VGSLGPAGSLNTGAIVDPRLDFPAALCRNSGQLDGSQMFRTTMQPEQARRPSRAAVRVACAAAVFVIAMAMPVTSLPTHGAQRHDRFALTFERQARSQSWISQTLSPQGAFRMVGASWPADDEPEGTASFRTSSDGRAWTGWTELEVSDIGPDPETTENANVASTEPVWVGEARHAQVKWSETAVAPRTVSFHLVDPGPDPSVPSSVAEAAPGMPGIVSRAQWGADESIRKCCPSFAPAVKFAVIHHTATSNNYGSGESSAIVRSIYQYHVKVSGFDDIGYSFLVDRYGRTFEGRAGGIRNAVIGAHTQGFNTGSTGVALMGTFQSSDPPTAAMDSVSNLLAWKLDIHHVNPKGSLTVVSGGSNKYPPGRSVNIPTIVGHRDLQTTQCPGDRVMSRLGGLRNNAHDRGLPKIFNPSVSPPDFTPNGDGSGDSLRIRATTAGASNWRIRVRNSSGSQLRSWTGGGQPNIVWDGRNSAGQAAPHGYYAVEIEASQGSAGATPAKVTAGLFRNPWGAWTAAGSFLDVREAQRVGARRGNFHLVSRAPDGSIHETRWSGSAWGAHRRLGGSNDAAATDGRLGLIADANGVLHVVIRGRQSHLYHGRIETNGDFRGWSRIGGANDRGRDLAIVADSAGVIHVMVEGMNGNLYWNRYNSGWSSWKRVGGSGARGTQPVLAAGSAGEVMAVVVGGSMVLYANKLDPGKSWRSGWSTVGSSKGSGIRPTVTSVKEGFLVAVRGKSTAHIWNTAGTPGSWSNWSRIGGSAEGGSEPAVITSGDDVMLVIRGKTGNILYFNVRAPTGGWRGWSQAGGTAQAGSFATLAKVGTTVMLAVDTGGAPATIIARPPLRGN